MGTKRSCLASRLPIARAICEALCEALRRIAYYDHGSGCCAYGCDTPSIAQQALKEG